MISAFYAPSNIVKHFSLGEAGGFGRLSNPGISEAAASEPRSQRNQNLRGQITNDTGRRDQSIRYRQHNQARVLLPLIRPGSRMIRLPLKSFCLRSFMPATISWFISLGRIWVGNRTTTIPKCYPRGKLRILPNPRPPVRRIASSSSANL